MSVPRWILRGVGCAIDQSSRTLGSGVACTSMDQHRPQEDPFDAGGPARQLDRVFDQFDAALRKAASRTLQQYAGAASLETGDVLHEAWLKLASRDEAQLAEYRSLELVAMRTVQNVVLDHLRRRRSRTSHLASRPMGPGTPQYADPAKGDEHRADVSEAIEGVAGYAPRVADVLRLRLLGRLSFDAIAQRLSASVRTVEGDWSFGRALLARRLGRS